MEIHVVRNRLVKCVKTFLRLEHTGNEILGSRADSSPRSRIDCSSVVHLVRVKVGLGLE